QEKRVDREKIRLNRASRQKELTPKGADQLVMAMILFDIRSGEDRKAMEKAERLHAKSPERFFSFLSSFAESHLWERLTEWLEWLVPMVRHTRSDVFGIYFEFWGKVLL